MIPPASPTRPVYLRSLLRVLAIADLDLLGSGAPAAVAAALRGGATSVQIRAKGADARELLEAARRLLPVCRTAGSPLLVNDRPDVALAAGADGAHLGPADLPVAAARRVLGGLLLGASARTAERAAEAARGGADYLGAGALRATATKGDTVVIGMEGIAAIVRGSALPVVAVGGVRPGDAAALRAAGAAGMAVVGGIFGAGDPERAARAYREAWDSVSGSSASS